MFSVIIPIYNHAAFLKQAVLSALRSPLVTEVLLVDDGSSDRSAEVAAQFAKTYERVCNLTTPGGGNRGAHYRLNELVAASKSDWIAILNSDDSFVDGRFDAMVSHPLFPQSDFVFGNLLLINESGTLTGAKRGPLDAWTPFPASFDVASLVAAGHLLDLLSHQNYIGTTSNMIFRKELHARIGGFAPYRYVHDWDFGLRAMAIARPLYVQRYLTAYRIHRHNTISESQERVHAEAKEMFRRFVADFPQIAAHGRFQVGLEKNVNLRSPTALAAGTQLGFPDE